MMEASDGRDGLSDGQGSSREGAAAAPPAKRQRKNSADLPPPASPDEFIGAALEGDAATVASALRNPLTDPNMTAQNGWTALMKAAEGGHAPVATLLLADERLNPNMTSVGSFTALIIAASKGHAPVWLPCWLLTSV